MRKNLKDSLIIRKGEKMKIIIPEINVEQLKGKVKNIDDNILEQIANIVITTRRNNEIDKIYSKLYESQHTPSMNLARKEGTLIAKLNILQAKDEELIKTSLQLKEYNWIHILRDEMASVDYGFYLAPNPNNMFEIVDELVAEFIKQRIPVKIKYQQERKFGECDRIVVYSDEKNKDKVEKCLAKVKSNFPKLFMECERALPWLYESKVPEIYLAPEKAETSYEQEFIKTIIESKEIFDYLQERIGTKFSTNLEANYDRTYLKQIIASMLLRNGLLMSNEGKRITFIDENISTVYDYRSGKLTNSNKEEQIYDEAIFMPTIEGREALLKNFYNVSKIEEQAGVMVQHLTPEERRMQLYKSFYR